MAHSNLLRLIESLRCRLDAGDEMVWERSNDQEFVLRLASPPMAITLQEDTSVDPPKLTVKAESTQPDTPEADRLIADEFLSDQEGYFDVQTLLDSAKQRFASISELLERGAQLLEAESGPVGAVEQPVASAEKEEHSEAKKAEWAKSVTGETVTPPVVPIEEPELVPASEDQTTRFFERIKGNWKRHHEQGFDELAIDELGDVYYRFTEQGQTVSKSPKPAFRLVLISCTPDLAKVEISREAVNGTMRQIEVLRIGETEMIGHAKHDHQLLQYRSVP